MKRISLPLIARIIIAGGLGIALAPMLPLWSVRIFVTFNALFSQFISFLVPLIIVGLVTPAICRMGSSARKLLLVTCLLAYISTILAGLFSYGAGTALLPRIVGTAGHLQGGTAGPEVLPYFELSIPPLLDVMSALVTAFLCGIFLTMTAKAPAPGTEGQSTEGRGGLFAVFEDLERIVMLSIQHLLIPFLPLYIFGIFLKITFTGEASPIFALFSKVIILIFLLSIAYMLFIFLVAGIAAKRHPLRCLGKMLTAYLTALGTSSSAATIPITLRQTIKCGVRSEVAGFTVPLCATVHLPGSMLKIVACCLAIMIMEGTEPTFSLMLGFIALLAVTMVAAPGVPGGAIMAAVGLIGTVLGFGEADQGLVIALYIVMDSFGTACNVTCDGALALMVDALSKRESGGNEEMSTQ